MTRKFDHNFKQWLYELAPVAEQKFNFAKMIKINAFLVLILHVFGTLLFLHFFLYAEEKKVNTLMNFCIYSIGNSS